MGKKLRIAVVFGGRSAEHEVSLVSAANIIRALKPEKYEIIPIGITKSGSWVYHPDILELLVKGSIESAHKIWVELNYGQRKIFVGIQSLEAIEFLDIDVVFPVLHGTFGEDGTVQGIFETLGIPYVGAGVLGSAVGMDKVIQKQLFLQNGLPVVPFLYFVKTKDNSENFIVNQINESLTYPLFVKPANLGSSIGITRVKSPEELPPAIELAFRFDRKIIVEQGLVNAREIEMSVLGNDSPRVSEPGEVIPGGEFYDYRAKYEDGTSTLIIPAKLPNNLKKKMQEAAILAYKSIDCSGMGRVDFLVQGEAFYVSEINTIPGFTRISMYPKLWEVSGLSYSDLLDELIHYGLERFNQRRSLQTNAENVSEWYKK